jgi:hypothetical protein
MNDNVKAEIKKLSKLNQYKNADEAIVEKIAQKNIVLRDLVDSGNFITDVEKKQAKKIFENYLQNNAFENFSDLSTLSILVYNEILASRLQKTINECTSKDGKSYISDKLLKAHSDLTNQILSLKTKLGIDKEEKEDEFTALQLLKKRFHQHIQENKNEFMLYVPFKCAGCGKQDVKPVLLRRRIKDFEVLEHPQFAGRFWFCAEAINDVKEGKLTKEQYSRYFKTGCDFVAWCIENEGRILPNSELEK